MQLTWIFPPGRIESVRTLPVRSPTECLLDCRAASRSLQFTQPTGSENIGKQYSNNLANVE